MNEKQIKEIIHNNPDWNFFAVVLTPWQANGVDVCIDYLKKKGVLVKGCVLIKSHQLSGKCIDETFFKTLDNNITVIDIGTFRRSLVSMGTKYLLAFFRALFNKNSSIQTVHVVCFGNVDFAWMDYNKQKRTEFLLGDDGTGGYTTTRRLNYVRNKRTKGTVYALAMDFFMKIRSLMYDKCFYYGLKQGWITDFRLLKYIKGAYWSNDASVNAYKMMVGTRLTSERESHYIDGKIIIAAVSFKENIISDLDEDVNLMDDIVNSLKSLGYGDRIVIKPHPRDMNVNKYDKYECTIMPKDIGSLEDVVGNGSAKPLAVISIFSSTMITMKLLFDVETISLGKVLIKKGVDDTLKLIVENYIKVSENYVYFPNDLQEFEEKMRAISLG